MMKYETVIWDWNGTLLDDVRLVLDVVNELFVEYSVEPLTADRYKEIFGFPVQGYYERAGMDLDKHDFGEISQKFCKRFEERLHLARLFPEVPQVLNSVRTFGARQFLLSGTQQQALHRMLKRYDLESHFEAAQGLEDNLAVGKLHAGVSLVSNFGIVPETTVMIGDTEHDAEVARHLGIDCILVSSGHHSAERLSRLGLPVYESIDAITDSLCFLG